MEDNIILVKNTKFETFLYRKDTPPLTSVDIILEHFTRWNLFKALEGRGRRML